MSNTPRKRATTPPPPELGAAVDAALARRQPGEVLDISARQAARQKAEKNPPKVKIGTVTYALPAELRLETLRGLFRLLDGDIVGLDAMFDEFFGADSWREPEELTDTERAELKGAAKAARTKREKAYNPAFGDLTAEDLTDIIGHVSGSYGIDLGNSAASTPS